MKFWLEFVRGYHLLKLSCTPLNLDINRGDTIIFVIINTAVIVFVIKIKKLLKIVHAFLCNIYELKLLDN